MMRHTCPNYAVPYEPHYGMPLVPFSPQLTSLFRSSLAHDELWRSLNFVTYGRITRYCRLSGLECRFDRGLLADAFARLDRDAAFRARRGPMLRFVHRLLGATGLLRVISLLPARWATPMAFTCWRSGEPAAEMVA
jgi:hypothetical protein